MPCDRGGASLAASRNHHRPHLRRRRRSHPRHRPRNRRLVVTVANERARSVVFRHLRVYALISPRGPRADPHTREGTRTCTWTSLSPPPPPSRIAPSRPPSHGLSCSRKFAIAIAVNVTIVGRVLRDTLCEPWPPSLTPSHLQPFALPSSSPHPPPSRTL